MRICLDAGHSYGLNGQGKDPGAVNKELGIKESVIAMELVRTLAKMLEDRGHAIIYTRTDGDDSITLNKRCVIANKAGVDIFISIHLNSFDSPKSNGIETLRYPTKNPYTIRLAKAIQTRLIEATGATDRGVKERGDLYVLKHTNMPAVLIEVGFISHREEGLKLNDPEYQRIVCKAIADGVSEVY